MEIIARILSFLVVCWMPLSVHAQGVRFGLYGQAAATTLHGWSEAQPSFRAGISVKVPISKSTALSNELGFSMVREQSWATFTESPMYSHYVMSFSSFKFLDFSPMLVIRNNRRLNVLAGPYTAMLFAYSGFAREIYAFWDESFETYTFYQGTSAYPTLDFGLRAGLAYRVTKGASAQLMYSQGLRQFTVDNIQGQRLLVRGIYMGVQYNFGKDPEAK